MKVEIMYTEIISLINPFLLLDNASFILLNPEPFVIPLLYGCPKIHKQNVPMRPIVSSVDMIGSRLSEWLLEKLQHIAAHLSKYNILNSTTLIPELKKFVMEPEHKICSLDYVSMFTNINVAETFAIILEFYHVISATTSVPSKVFIKCLEFFTNHSTFFLFNGDIFKQIKGLAMGNRLAQVLAEIRTNFALYDALKGFDADIISFMYKYVDDIFTSIHNDHIDRVANKISETVGMELTVTKEDNDLDVQFLDCIFRRNHDSSVSSRWLKKNYSSLSILNYHSYHPMNMKRNVVIEMIKHAYAITSPEFVEHTKGLLIDILKRSSYPEYFIIENVCLKPPVETIREISMNPMSRYVSCPYVNPLFRNIQSIINENELKVKLAPKPSSNNKLTLLSRIKDVRDELSMKNAVFKVRCLDCDFIHTTATKNFDVKRTYQRLMDDRNSPCNQHIVNFPHHCMDENVKIMKTFHNKFDVEHSRYVFNYIDKLKENH